MKFTVVLNKDGGTLKTTDLKAFSELIKTTLEAKKHQVDIQIVKGKGVEEAIDAAARRRSVDVVMVGGGDGTISAAAARLMGTNKALAVLPTGTMNLFARSLKIPLDIEKAVEAFATGRRKQVDIALANGRPFIHQVSIGMHAKMVQLREKMEFGSRLVKIKASAKAAYSTIRNPPRINVEIDIEGEKLEAKATGVGFTNNLFGEGHLPYADRPAGGVLGVYLTSAIKTGELVSFAYGMARGKLKDNQHVDVYRAKNATLRILTKRKLKCVVDGELMTIDPETIFELKAKALRVLVPGAKKKS